MSFKFWKMAKVAKGNKRDFHSNDLTRGLAEKQAKADIKKEKKVLTKKQNHVNN